KKKGERCTKNHTRCTKNHTSRPQRCTKNHKHPQKKLKGVSSYTCTHKLFGVLNTTSTLLLLDWIIMSELVVLKANELAMSRYDLTEHETKLILCCVALLNPTIDNPTIADRTITFTYQKYAEMMGLSNNNAYHRLKISTRELMTRTVEIIYTNGPVSERIFQWVNYAEFNKETKSLKLVFSEHIIPYLFQLKRFIKYNLEHVKSFDNKYSMRTYEWLLKELTQRKTNKSNIEISIDDFKFMMMIDNHKSYEAYKELNRKILTPISKDLNTHSNIKVFINKKGRPADTLIFQVELDSQIDLVNELTKDPEPIPAQASYDERSVYEKLVRTLTNADSLRIKLTSFEQKFLTDMKNKHDLNGSFSWLTVKQKSTLEKILSKYQK
ncbi:TPA: replication initiation protein, partial [Shigella sonnei]